MLACRTPPGTALQVLLLPSPGPPQAPRQLPTSHQPAGYGLGPPPLAEGSSQLDLPATPLHRALQPLQCQAGRRRPTPLLHQRSDSWRWLVGPLQRSAARSALDVAPPHGCHWLHGSCWTYLLGGCPAHWRTQALSFGFRSAVSSLSEAPLQRSALSLLEGQALAFQRLDSRVPRLAALELRADQRMQPLAQILR